MSTTVGDWCLIPLGHSEKPYQLCLNPACLRDGSERHLAMGSPLRIGWVVSRDVKPPVL